MKRNLLTTLACLLCFAISSAQLRISADKRFLRTNDDKPFLWLGDTGWELFHLLNREEASLYLEDRARKGFNIIQSMLVSVGDDGLSGNAYGNPPLLNNNPATPNEAFFQHVDFIVNKAEQLGLIMAIAPTWGDKWLFPDGTNGIFNQQNSEAYGLYLGRRYQNKPIVWMLGGDRIPISGVHYAVLRAMAQGLRAGMGGQHLLTYHPNVALASDYLRHENWLDIDMAQTGHSSLSLSYQVAQKGRQSFPTRPYIEGESRYEDHPDRFNPGIGWLDEFDVRQTAYWAMLSGAAGYTFGNHNIWQFNGEGGPPTSYARNHWRNALNQPGATQMGIMKKFFEKFAWQNLVPNQTVLLGGNPNGQEHIVASLSQDRNLLLAYSPYGRVITLNTNVIGKSTFCAYWFNPREDRTTAIGSFQKKEAETFTAPSQDRGNDWVLVIDANCDDAPQPPPPPPVENPKPEEPQLSATAFPNPSSGSFKVTITSNSNLPIDLYLYNQYGNLIGSLKNYDRTVPITIPDEYLEKGKYFGVALQGNVKISLTLIKL